MIFNSGETPATLIYGPNGFRVVKDGNFVFCAATEAPIPLDELRYWSVDRQEPYASAELSTETALKHS